MSIESLKIKNQSYYYWNDTIYIDDFDIKYLKINKRESRAGIDIYYIGYVLYKVEYIMNSVVSLYLNVRSLLGSVEKINGSSDRYLVIDKNNIEVINVFNTIKEYIEDKIISTKIDGFDEIRFSSDIDLPLEKLIEFKVLTIIIKCIIKKNDKYYPENYLDECLWATPAKIINLLDFKPEKLSIKTENDESSIKVHQVRYENGGFYLTIDNIKDYFSFGNNNMVLLDMIFSNDDQKNKYHQVWKEIFKFVRPKELGNEELKIHEKIVLFDSDIPTDKIIKIPSVTIVIKSLLEKNNEFYLELSLNHLSYKL